jgi:hypothetical protein
VACGPQPAANVFVNTGVPLQGEKKKLSWDCYTNLTSCAAAHWTQGTVCVTVLTVQQSSPGVSSLAAAPSSVTVQSTNTLISTSQS